LFRGKLQIPPQLVIGIQSDPTGSPLMARRVISLPRGNPFAFGPNRTLGSCGRAEAVGVERAADPLHRARMDAEAFGYLAHDGGSHLWLATF
jgi:hypothetical protein